jgi:hypothetical protein
MHLQRRLNISRTKIAVALLVAGISQGALANGFLPGNLIVSRTVYEGTASTVTLGQTLPGGGVAIADGSFPNVFTNESKDASFGVTSPIYLDQFTTSGSLIDTKAIDASVMTTSFASKSELALNVSTDGKSVTFMGYAAPKNTLDVSNSNTSQAFDSTNPVGATYARAVANVNLSTGNVQVTNVNAYSGNNGRGNGATLSQLSDNTGVQRIAAGSSGNTTAVGVAQGTYGSSTGYQRGYSLAQTPDPANPGHNYAADKTGKDDNFRGMTVFNNTLYVTKGSGSNGVNTVYQVGTS